MIGAGALTLRIVKIVVGYCERVGLASLTGCGLQRTGRGFFLSRRGIFLSRRRFCRLCFGGSFLLIGMACTTLSFLVTTPETWVHGFPFLSIAGRLIIKDAIMLGAAVVTMADSAKAHLEKNSEKQSSAGASVSPPGTAIRAR